MSEQNPGPTATFGVPTPTNIRTEEPIGTPAAEAEAAARTAGAAELGIDEPSYDKYVKDGVMDWASYGKEVAFKAKQVPEGQGAADAAAATAAAEAAATQAAEDAKNTAGAEELVKKAGLDWDEVSAQVTRTGELTAADKQKIMDLGIPENVIDNYVESTQREVGAIIDDVMAGFGGEEAFNKVWDGVQTNATQEQRDQIDSLIRDKDTFDIGVAMATKLAGVDPVAPVAPREGAPVAGAVNQQAGGAAETTGEAYPTYQEQVLAQSDPRYKNDPAYRDSVIKRIMATPAQNPRAHTSGM